MSQEQSKSNNWAAALKDWGTIVATLVVAVITAIIGPIVVAQYNKTQLPAASAPVPDTMSPSGKLRSPSPTARLPEESKSNRSASLDAADRTLDEVKREQPPVSFPPTAMASPIFYGFAFPGVNKRVKLSLSGFSPRASRRVYSDLDAAEHTAEDFSPTEILTISKTSIPDPVSGDCYADSKRLVTLEYQLVVSATGTVAFSGATTGDYCIGDNPEDAEMFAVDQAVSHLKKDIHY
jgi:hypothetical protein